MAEEEKKRYTAIQEKVINLNKNYNLVLAGPGCGKTDILAERIARATENGVAISDILCLTFTNRAARGMFERIKKRLQGNVDDLFVGNIHRYCSHFLFDESVVPAESIILDENDTADILLQLIPDSVLDDILDVTLKDDRYALYSIDTDIANDVLDLDLHPSGYTGLFKYEKIKKAYPKARIQILAQQHCFLQRSLNHDSEIYLCMDYIEVAHIPNLNSLRKTVSGDFDELAPVYKIARLAFDIWEYKKNSNFLDFDDLLIITYDAYLNDTKGEYKKYPWVQIDEVQDLSNFQIALVDLLTDHSDDFVTVYFGDEQQAIFSFMGASLGILERLKHRCGDVVYRLDKNFRSPKYLLDLYNDYAVSELKTDPDFLPQPKDDQQANIHDVTINIYEDENEEEQHVQDIIIPYLNSSSNRNQSSAILVSWNRDAEAVSGYFNNAKIPHFKISGTDVFSSRPIKIVTSHFSVVNNEFNSIAWSRILYETNAVRKLADGRKLVDDMRKIALSPTDLMLYNNSSYLQDFCRTFEQEEFVIFDTETTGVDIFNDDIVQIAAVKVRNGDVVPNSSFNIFLETNKQIPPMLGKLVNPMAKEYPKAYKYSRREGLQMFLDYIGNLALLGHNVNFDFNILRYNLQRIFGNKGLNFTAKYFDSLKLAHLLYPNFRKFKLGYLVERLGLGGINSHMADADIMATYHLTHKCYLDAQPKLEQQNLFLQSKVAKRVADELDFAYKECYTHSKEELFKLHSEDEFALIQEWHYASQFLLESCEIKPSEKYVYIIDFFENEVLTKEEPNALFAHLSNHLMDILTFKEGDICDSKSIKANIFVSTIHKAKGLEFDNVIILHAVSGRFPSFAHPKPEEQQEDKRLFYVAMSRAKKRLIVTTTRENLTPFVESVQNHFCIRIALNKDSLVSVYRNRIYVNNNGIIYQSNDIRNIAESKSGNVLKFSLSNLAQYRRSGLAFDILAEQLKANYGITFNRI